jgi:hypothetical protein
MVAPQPTREYVGWYLDTSMKRAEVSNGCLDAKSNDDTKAKIDTTSPEFLEGASKYSSDALAIAKANHIETDKTTSSDILAPAPGPHESKKALFVQAPPQPNKSASCPNWPKITSDFGRLGEKGSRISSASTGR